MKSKTRKIFLLLFIVFFAIFIRFINLSVNPPALYGDELTIGLDSRSLLQTGKDQTGKLFPLIFEMGAGRPFGYVYASIPFVGIFGADPIGVRMVSALSGVFLVVLIFLIGRKLISTNAGLFGAFLMAISPWDISLSRVGFEAHFALFLSVLGIYLFLKAKTNAWFYPLSAVAFGLAIHSYPTFKLTLFLMIPVLVILTVNISTIVKNRTQIVIAFLIIMLFAFLSLFQTFYSNSEERFSRINIFVDSENSNFITQKINNERTYNTLSSDYSVIFHNKLIEYSVLYMESYLNNFSSDFLIFKGDGNPRHNVTTSGAIYLAQVILIVIGFFYLFNSNKRIFLLLTFWLLISPIPTAFLGVTHFLRSSFMLPPLVLISAAGFIYLIKFKWGKIVSLIFILSILLQFLFFSEKLFMLTPNLFDNFWSTPAKQASKLTNIKKDSFDYIFLSDKIDNIEYAYPFYSNQDSNTVISQNKKKTIISGREFKKFGNVYIGNIPAQDFDSFSKNLSGRILFLTSITDRINLSDYEIVEDNQNKEILIFKTNQI